MFKKPPQALLTRQAMVQAQRSKRSIRDATLAAALVSLDGVDPVTGQTDMDQLRIAIKKRFGYGIKKAESKDEYDTYERSAVAKALDHGLLETVVIRSYRTIVEALATLFTQDDQAYTYSVEGVADTVATLRRKGNYSREMIRGDRLGTGMGSCLVRVLQRSGGTQYEAIPVQNVFLGYGVSVFEGSQRATDTSDIEDASVVAIRLPHDADETTVVEKWIAYMGRSEKYPRGRCVEYLAREWFNIPEPGSVGAIDFLYEGAVANPLTVVQEIHGADKVPYEYPVAVLYGTDAGTSTLPINGLSLYQVCTELDIAWSRLIRAAISGAVGTVVIEREGDHSTAALPISVEGFVALSPGHKLTWGGRDTSHAKNAADVLSRLQRTVAESWSVPGFVAFSEDSSSPQSGYSLLLRSQPLVRKRSERVKLNEDSVNKIFHLEFGLLTAATGEFPWPPETTQTWYAGSWQPPRNEKEYLEELEKAKSLRLIDDIEMLKLYHGLDDAAAADLQRKYAERSHAVPPGSGGAE